MITFLMIAVYGEWTVTRSSVFSLGKNYQITGFLDCALWCIKMIKSLSKQEYDLLSTFAIKNRKVITVVKGSFNFTDGKIRVMLHRLEKKGWLERIEKGKYLIVPLEGREGWAKHPFIPISKLVTDSVIQESPDTCVYDNTLLIDSLMIGSAIL